MPKSSGSESIGTSLAMNSFELTAHDLGSYRLAPAHDGERPEAGRGDCGNPPLVRHWISGGAPGGWLQREEPAMRKFEVMAGAELAGVIVIQDPFLHGPYLKLIAILPEFQGQSLGLRLLQWMEAEARRAEARQLWLCVSTFNARARALLRAFRLRIRHNPGQARVRRVRRTSDAEAPFLRRLVPADLYCTSRTIRPLTLPSRICRASASASFQECVCVIPASLPRSRSLASRDHA